MTHPHQARRRPFRASPGRAGFLVAMTALLLALFATSSLAQNLLTDADVEKIPAGSQPIKFSHKIHAGDNAIPCQYCHIYARRSKVSGVPPVAICNGCHKLINPGLAEIAKVNKYWEEKKPIPWVKIHDLPDFVRYDHSRHVNAKNEVYPNGIPCQTCHGPIETMHVVEKFHPDFGTMGWCLTCHLTIPGTLEQKRATGEAATVKLVNAKHPAGNYQRPRLTDCLTCHY